MQQKEKSPFDCIEILEEVKIKDKANRLNLNIIYTTTPLFAPGEIIIELVTKKRKNLFQEVTIIIEPKTGEYISVDSLTKSMPQLIDPKLSNFRRVGENRYLYYASINPVASLIDKNKMV